MPQAVLALDLSRFVGWALGPPGARPTCGTHELPNDIDNGDYFWTFEEWLVGFVYAARQRKMPIGALAFEMPFAWGGKAPFGIVFRLWGLPAIASKVAAQCGYRILPLSNSTITKHFIGRAKLDTGLGRTQNRKAKKEAVIAEAKRRGWNPQNDNEADALAVWALAIFELFPESSEAVAHMAGSDKPLFAGGRG